MKYIFLPPYSPNFNPIETAFSAIKIYIQQNGNVYRSAIGNRTSNQIDILFQLHKAVHSVTPTHAATCFWHCGYI